MKRENPWNVQSLYNLQYFNCPSPFCIYKNNSKQKFFNHAYEFHPEADQYLRNINDGSTSELEIPVDIKFDPSYDDSETNHEILDDITEDPKPQFVDRKLSFDNSHIAVDLLEEENYCKKCKIMFCNQNSLLEHSNLVHSQIQLNDQLDIYGGNYEQENDEKENISHDNYYLSEKSNHEDDNMDNLPRHKCEFCHKFFVQPQHLKRHIRRFHDSYKASVCETCGISFADELNLRFHIHTVHEGNKDFKCDYCNKLFTQANNLTKHVQRIHTGECAKMIKCDYCPRFVKKNSLNKHMRRVHDGCKDIGKDCKCETCGKSFAEELNLRFHIHTVHEGHKDFKCDYCDKSFTIASKLKNHIQRNHTGGGAKKIKCDYCPKILKKYLLNNHIERNHAENQDVQCDTCSKKFNNSKKLKDHIRGVHSQTETSKCEKCGKLLKHKQSLKIHIRTAHDQIETEMDVMIKCDHCEKILKKSYMKLHIKEVHEKQRNYVCDTCGIAFTQKGSLITHSAVHTGLRAYKCDACVKTYKTSSSLNTHKKIIHEGRREHVCNYCAKAFGAAEDLKLHTTVIHLGIKKWKCDLCPIKYGQSHQLKKHYLKNHGKIYHIPKHGDNTVKFIR